MELKVLIAGISGASLGTEILKCLKLARDYTIYGADISPYAYGLYQNEFEKTFTVSSGSYISDILSIVQSYNIAVIIPGGEEPLSLLMANKHIFDEYNIRLAINDPATISVCQNKLKTFEFLQKHHIAIPRTERLVGTAQLASFDYPCIIKPSTDSGGSVFVSFAETEEEAISHYKHLKKIGISEIIIQEYISHQDGEFTVGVLSSPEGEIIDTVGLKKVFGCKMSYKEKSEKSIISSGYSQGLIDNFPEIHKQAEKISQTLQSKGPLNIQGRIKNSVFHPFEINCRFSASSYLRAMAGVNDIDIFIKSMLNLPYEPSPKKYGYYFRTLHEQFVPKNRIKEWSNG
ncbi:ATP-grasp domain-containing protein [Candidatus Babeliales bacterium]|nr:ATP-grasp domain-containing protein [Candidatus Babeliales bacterium]